MIGTGGLVGPARGGACKYVRCIGRERPSSGPQVCPVHRYGRVVDGPSMSGASVADVQFLEGPKPRKYVRFIGTRRGGEVCPVHRYGTGVMGQGEALRTVDRQSNATRVAIAKEHFPTATRATRSWAINRLWKANRDDVLDVSKYVRCIGTAAGRRRSQVCPVDRVLKAREGERAGGGDGNDWEA